MFRVPVPVPEEACESKGGSAVLLALDWAKAFDSLDPSALNRALVRFGIPRPFVDMVNGYTLTDGSLYKTGPPGQALITSISAFVKDVSWSRRC